MEKYGMGGARGRGAAEQARRDPAHKSQFRTPFITRRQTGTVVTIIPVGVQRGLADLGGHRFKSRTRFPELLGFRRRIAPGRTDLIGDGDEDQQDQHKNRSRNQDFDKREGKAAGAGSEKRLHDLRLL
jgi:hypothetical protein